MKKFFVLFALVAVIAAVTLSACNKPAEEAPVTEETQVEETTPAPAPMDTTAAMEAPVEAAPAAPGTK